MDLNEFENQDFYCWESISIETESREIDLVIKNKTHMDKLIKYLIYVLKTKDGSRGTALREYKLCTDRETRNAKFVRNVDKLSTWQETKVTEKVRFELCSKIFAKYNLMRIRSKISYYAHMR